MFFERQNFMEHKGTISLETERLILRRFKVDDAEAVYKNWASDPEVTKFLTWPTHTSVNVSKSVLESWVPMYENESYYHWAITLKDNGDEPVGSIHGLVNDDADSIRVGYALSRSQWHKGIMSEALNALMEFFFDKVGANSICSYHDPNNPHSGMVMMKCGMKYDGTLRQSDRNNQGIVDASWYSILKSEWNK